MSKNQKIFVSVFVIGISFVSTWGFMVFTTPGISETVIMRIRTVLNPDEYYADAWQTTGSVSNPYSNYVTPSSTTTTTKKSSVNYSTTTTNSYDSTEYGYSDYEAPMATTKTSTTGKTNTVYTSASGWSVSSVTTKASIYTNPVTVTTASFVNPKINTTPSLQINKVQGTSLNTNVSTLQAPVFFVTPGVRLETQPQVATTTTTKTDNLWTGMLRSIKGLFVQEVKPDISQPGSLTIQKIGGNDVKTSDIKDVRYQPCEIKNLRLVNKDKGYKYGDWVGFNFEAKCDYQSYTSYVQLKYQTESGKYEYMYTGENIADKKTMEASFLLPTNNLKIIDNKLTLNVDIYQCRYIVTDMGDVRPDPNCLESFKNNQNDLDSISSKNFILNFPTNFEEVSSGCTYSIVSPIGYSTIVEEGGLKNSQMETRLLVSCPKSTSSQTTKEENKKLKIWETTYCKDNKTEYWEQIGPDKKAVEKSYSIYKNTEFSINKYFFYLDGVFNGSYKDCYIKTTVFEYQNNDSFGISKEIITNFQIQKCKIELKNADPKNSLDNPYYTSKTGSFPLSMIFYCDRNSDSPQPDRVQYSFDTGSNTYARYYGGQVMYLPIKKERVTKISNKEYLLDANISLSNIAEMMEIQEGAQSSSHVNFFITSYADLRDYGKDGNGPWYNVSNNFIEPIKDTRVYFYYDGKSPNAGPPKGGGETTPTFGSVSPKLETTSKMTVFNKIWNFVSGFWK